MGIYLEQVLKRSNVVKVIATHYGLDYGYALDIAEAHRRKAAGEHVHPRFDEAVAEAQGRLGPAYGGFRKLLQDAMVHRFGEGARLD